MKSRIALIALGAALAAGMANAQDNGINGPEWKALLTRPAAVSQPQPTDTRQAPVDKYEFLYKYSPY